MCGTKVAFAKYFGNFLRRSSHICLVEYKMSIMNLPLMPSKKETFLRFRISSLIRGKKYTFEPSRTRRVYFINTFEISSWREYFVTFHLLSFLPPFTTLLESVLCEACCRCCCYNLVFTHHWLVYVYKAAQNHAVSANWKCSQCFG